MGALPPNPRSFPHWVKGYQPRQTESAATGLAPRCGTEAQAPLTMPAAPVALQQSRILRTTPNCLPSNDRMRLQTPDASLSLNTGHRECHPVAQLPSVCPCAASQILRNRALFSRRAALLRFITITAGSVILEK